MDLIISRRNVCWSEGREKFYHCSSEILFLGQNELQEKATEDNVKGYSIIMPFITAGVDYVSQ